MARPALSPEGETVRARDPDRYLCALFADPPGRERLFALHAFDLEAAAGPGAAREPMLARIRLQWWREALDAIAAGKPPRGAAEALARAFEGRRFDREAFDRLLDGREAELEEAPFATGADLLAHARDTAGSLSRLALVLLDAEDAPAAGAAGDAAAAWGVARTLAAAPRLAREGRIGLPRDAMARAGARTADWRELRDTPELRAAAREAGRGAAERLEAARARLRAEGRAGFRRAAPALLPGRLAALRLARVAAAGWNLFDPAIGAPAPGRIWRLWMSALSRRI